jgi:transposase-like protein
VDETYVRIRGGWAYLYRAVDASGKTVDFRLSPRRNVASAKAFFLKPVRAQGRSPETITLDGFAAAHRAVRELQQQGRLAEVTKLRSSKHLNNLVEQDHRNVKSRLGVMLGLKSFASAATTIRGVELMHRIRKNPFDLRALATQGQTTLEFWAAVLAEMPRVFQTLESHQRRCFPATIITNSFMGQVGGRIKIQDVGR